MLFLQGLALVTLILLLLLSVQAFFGSRSIRLLRDRAPLSGPEVPHVSVVIPARNEARGIEAALRSVLSQDYAALQVIVVDDRSTDGTGEILDRLARNAERLDVHHLDALPPGWLGKTHALDYGARKATGDYLLFVDADVVLDPSTIARAVGFMQANGLDHLVLGPDIRMSGALLNMLVLAFASGFFLFQRPWRARQPASSAFVGGGAFSLLSRQAYRASGAMQAIALCVDDDLKLGKLVKRQGFRQEFVAGKDLVHIEWYASLSEMISGLTKNFFAVLDYRFRKLVLGTCGLFLVHVWPLPAVLLTSGSTRLLNAAILLVTLVLYLGGARWLRISPWYAFGFPLANAILIYIIWRSGLVTWLRGGVNWRGTHYSLEELKRNNL